MILCWHHHLWRLMLLVLLSGLLLWHAPVDAWLLLLLLGMLAHHHLLWSILLLLLIVWGDIRVAASDRLV